MYVDVVQGLVEDDRVLLCTTCSIMLWDADKERSVAGFADISGIVITFTRNMARLGMAKDGVIYQNITGGSFSFTLRNLFYLFSQQRQTEFALTFSLVGRIFGS